MNVPDHKTHALRIRPLAACLAVACTLAAPAPACADGLATHTLPIFDALRARAAAAAGDAPRKSPSAPLHPATTRQVTNCLDDDSAGSLRTVVGEAGDGDTVDLSALTCSTITLESGVIFVSVDNLTLTGPGTSLTIDGNYMSSLFAHFGVGALSIDNLRLRRGLKYENTSDNALGGCIYSSGSVALNDAYVTQCIALFGGAEANHYARGGAIYARGDVSMIRSAVTVSIAGVGTASNAAPGNAVGGGIYGRGDVTLLDSVVSQNGAVVWAPDGSAACGGVISLGNFTAKYSTISANMASGLAYSNGACGGVGAFHDVSLISSTISRNTAGSIGGMYLAGVGNATITNSTISMNYAPHAFGGIVANQPTTIENSTIAFNASPGSLGGGGLITLNGIALDLESTIIAGNTSGGTYAADLDALAAVTVTGANNLVRFAGANATLPTDTINTDPLLGPLQDNGGATETHMLRPGSPAINTGNNVAGNVLDQRGPGFLRLIGAAADIGAVETNPDEIFASGFQ